MNNVLGKLVEERLSRLAEDGELDGKVIAVFGSYDAVGVISGVLERLKIKISFVLNNDPNMKQTQGLSVYLPEKILIPMIDNVAILIASAYYDEMKLQLEGMGYIENVHIYNLDKDTKTNRDRLIKDFSVIKKQLKDSFELYKRLISQYGEDTTICLCGFTHLGDIFKLCRDLKKEGISDCVLVFRGNQYLDIAAMFGIENTYVAGLREIEGFGYLYRWFHMDGSPFKIRTYEVMGHEWVHIHAIYKNSKPQIKTTPQRALETHKRPQLPDKKRELEELFRDNCLRKGRTVLIAPSAQTHQLLPVRVWEAIIEGLLERNYTVCLNSALSQDVTDIKGALQISPPLESVIQFVEYAGYFIGVRSGFCDFINMADCKRVVLYTPMAYHGADAIPVFHSTLKTCRYEFERGGDSLEELREIDCVNQTEEEIVSEVIDALEN